MTGVAIEQMLELWCVELRQVKADLQSLFAHPGVGASATAQALTTWLDNVVGLAVGCPGTEMPYSISVPMIRRTLMWPTLGGSRRQGAARFRYQAPGV